MWAQQRFWAHNLQEISITDRNECRQLTKHLASKYTVYDNEEKSPYSSSWSISWLMHFIHAFNNMCLKVRQSYVYTRYAREDKLRWNRFDYFSLSISLSLGQAWVLSEKYRYMNYQDKRQSLDLNKRRASCLAEPRHSITV